MSDEKESNSRMLGAVGLNALLTDKFKLWKTPDNEPYADYYHDSVRHSIPVRSDEFKNAVYALSMRLAAGKIPSKNGIEEFQAMCAAHATIGRKVREVELRVATKNGALYYDLNNEDNEIVAFADGKWEVKVADAEAPRFLRPLAMREQITPRQPSRDLVSLLRPFIAVKNDADLHLAAAWLVGCFKPKGPYPVLIINGEQGSAKSTTTRVLRKLVDPHGLDMREPPASARDLVAAAKNSFVLAFDNMSTMPAWLSDRLCMVATGTGALGGRALYTNSDEAAYSVCRPIIINGIPAFVEREDLADRAINLELPAITGERRMDDDTFWGKFNDAYPEILGAIFAAVAVAHRDFGTTVLRDAPRMANFARWAVAGLGVEAGTTFYEAYARNRKDAAEHFIEHSEVTQAVLAMMLSRDSWIGTWVELLDAITKHQPSHGTKFWPENSLQLRNRLVRSAKELRAVGLEWKAQGRESGTGRSRLELYKAKDFASRGYAVSAVSA